MVEAVLSTQLSLPNKRSGKVRDLYDVKLDNGEEALLIIATDRISAFDVGLSNDEREILKNRVMLCKKTRVVPIECIARGYITGSGWKDYQTSGAVCGIELP